MDYGVRRNVLSHLIHIIFWEYSEHIEQYESSTTLDIKRPSPSNLYILQMHLSEVIVDYGERRHCTWQVILPAISGFPDRSMRGPICLDCSHAGSVEECDTVTLCSSNQVRKSTRVANPEWGSNSGGSLEPLPPVFKYSKTCL